MSIAVNQSRDLVTYLTTGNFSAGRALNITGEPTPRMGWRYYDRLDVIYTRMDAPGGGAGILDPLFLDNTNPIFGQFSGTFGSMVIGQLDRIANTQRAYEFTVGGNLSLNEVNPIVLAQTIDSDPWPNYGVYSSRVLAPGVPGYYVLTEGTVLFFGDDGQPGSYGKALQTWCSCTHTDSVTYAEVAALVDLETGVAEILPIPVSYGALTHQFAEPTLFGDVVDFRNCQFVGDDDSTHAAPKGFLVFTSLAVNAGGSNRFCYVKLVEFNPLDAPGTPNRIHLRERLLTRYNVEEGQFGVELDGVFAFLNEAPIYHSPSRQILHPTSASSVSLPYQADEIGVLNVPITPVLDLLTPPSPRTTVETNSIVIFSSDARGDLNEPISGARVDWTLERVSTVAEVLATTPTPGETVVVDQFPMDELPREVVVYEDGTPLVETTNYTVNRTTGQITFVAPKPLAGGEVYTADYYHEADPASPPHGRLLNQTGTSDENGELTARIEYEDDAAVVDQRDRIQVDTI